MELPMRSSKRPADTARATRAEQAAVEDLMAKPSDGFVASLGLSGSPVGKVLEDPLLFIRRSYYCRPRVDTPWSGTVPAAARDLATVAGHPLPRRFASINGSWITALSCGLRAYWASIEDRLEVLGSTDLIPASALWRWRAVTARSRPTTASCCGWHRCWPPDAEEDLTGPAAIGKARPALWSTPMAPSTSESWFSPLLRLREAVAERPWQVELCLEAHSFPLARWRAALPRPRAANNVAHEVRFLIEEASDGAWAAQGAPATSPLQVRHRRSRVGGPPSANSFWCDATPSARDHRERRPHYQLRHRIAGRGAAAAASRQRGAPRTTVLPNRQRVQGFLAPRTDGWRVARSRV